MTQDEFLRMAVKVFEELGVPCMLVGAIASTYYGEPRFTKDIDIVAELRPGDIETLCREFPDPDFRMDPEAARRAVQSRGQFNIIHGASGNKLDVLLPPDTLWGGEQIRRRRRMPILPNVEGYVAGADDVIVGKMMYYAEGGSEKHLRDITGILKVSGDSLDRPYIDESAAKLGVTEIWERIKARVDRIRTSLPGP